MNGALPARDSVNFIPVLGHVRGERMKLSDRLRNTVRVEPMLVRPDQAALILGSIELLDELTAAGWLEPVVNRKRLKLFSVADLQGCVARLQAGESLPDDAELLSPDHP